MADSPWQGVRGYHVLRHSFISALASEAEDQRVIDEVVGHQSEEPRKRYRHLCPNLMREAITRVFGSRTGGNHWPCTRSSGLLSSNCR
jgi:site-specific recombinase XerD